MSYLWLLALSSGFWHFQMAFAFARWFLQLSGWLLVLFGIFKWLVELLTLSGGFWHFQVILETFLKVTFASFKKFMALLSGFWYFQIAFATF